MYKRQPGAPARQAHWQPLKVADSTRPDSSLGRAARRRRRRRRMQRERVKTNCIKDKGRQTAAKDQNDACLRSRAFHNVLCFTHLCIYVSVFVCQKLRKKMKMENQRAERFSDTAPEIGRLSVEPGLHSAAAREAFALTSILESATSLEFN